MELEELQDLQEDLPEFDDDLDLEELEDWDETEAQRVMHDVVPQRGWD
jgi:hypothetical protein